jgi:transcriptional regulator with GAF, ATPase, and Fis domain
MITVNCAALPAELIESELFGHDEGAYTGAVSSQKGRFELANKGTLFLDEIGELPITLQSKILRVIQEGQFERLGSSKSISVDIRLITATNQDLAKAIKENEFRADLYYRISTFPIRVPPLRERIDDIPILVKHFIDKLAPGFGKTINSVSNELLDDLMQRHWPGNVRELENVIARAILTCEGTILTLNRNGSPTDKGVGLESLHQQKMTLEQFERTYILNVLNSSGWKVSGLEGAAQILGLPSSTLRSRMKKLGIARDKFN